MDFATRNITQMDSPIAVKVSGAPLRTAFTGRNTVNRAVPTPLSKDLFALGESVVPIRLADEGADRTEQLKEQLALELLKVHQKVEEVDTQDLQDRILNSAESLASNMECIQDIKESLDDQTEEQLEVVGTEDLEGTLILEARKEQLRDRDVIQALHKEDVRVQHTASHLQHRQHKQARALHRLRWKHAALHTQMQELDEHQSDLLNRADNLSDENIKARADIVIMQAQNVVHRKRLADQEVELRRLNTEHEVNEDCNTRSIGRMLATMHSGARRLEELGRAQSVQLDDIRSAEQQISRIQESVEIAEIVAEAAADAQRVVEIDHMALSTVAQQQDIVSSQQRKANMADLRMRHREGDLQLLRLQKQQLERKTRTDRLAQRVWAQSSQVNDEFGAYKMNEQLLAEERERSQKRELQIAKAAGNAMHLLREEVEELETMIKQSDKEIEKLALMCIALRRQSSDLVTCLDQEAVEHIYYLDDCSATINELEHKIEWFGMVSAQHRIAAAKQQRMAAEEEDEIMENLSTAAVAGSSQAMPETELAPRQQLRQLLEEEVEMGEDEEESLEDEEEERIVGREESLEMENEDECEDDVPVDYYCMKTFIPEYYVSPIVLEVEEI